MSTSMRLCRAGAAVLTAGVLSIVLPNLAGCREAKKQPATPSEAAKGTSNDQRARISASMPARTQPAAESSLGEPSFTIASPKAETKLDAQKRIGVTGTHSLPSDAHAWLFLIDVFGGYYLQNPPVELLSKGRWEQNNVIPGKGIQHIVAVQVGEEGHRRILGWVGVNRWGKIPSDEIKSLPGYRELDRVRVATPAPE